MVHGQNSNQIQNFVNLEDLHGHYDPGYIDELFRKEEKKL